MGKRIVIALGGNALGNNAEEQIELVKQTAQTIVDMAEEGYEVIVGHGNGPQVGMINLAMEFAANNGGGTPAMPFPECGAMSQGYIGYHLQQAIQNELRKRKIDKHCASVVTQMIVDENDPAFEKPTKPVGLFYTEEESVKLAAEKGYSFMEDAGRGYRRVVASPLPKEIVEIDLIKQLTGQGDIVITVGGGGIPVIETAEGYKGVAAVIDKDRSCSKLALDLNADMLIILTAVDRVCIHYNTPQQEELATMNVAEAKQYIKEGHFAPGSMLPKIEACLDFVEHASEGQALVTSLVRAKDALAGVTGTIIEK
ncbi:MULTISPECIES: carbamate kinase [unclassified Erysipelothrix]|uniref:carbamate kinase n=1 Tax=unclassified Erysipelothrix TaxID=2624170 RepID=UPI00190D107D|nr:MULTISPECIES: carbamate kinase [unclassified Erysipelothrix]MBK2402422.1 carbamate kinase [Erysipelothrix sp. strain 2 (EsS2-6-Brazil)]MBK2403310.1 carbamate kinase [Erysipelothrix sp. strain 2 (EsS2-7-Brazil)]